MKQVIKYKGLVLVACLICQIMLFNDLTYAAEEDFPPTIKSIEVFRNCPICIGE